MGSFVDGVVNEQPADPRHRHASGEGQKVQKDNHAAIALDAATVTATLAVRFLPLPPLLLRVALLLATSRHPHQLGPLRLFSEISRLSAPPCQSWRHRANLGATVQPFGAKGEGGWG